MALDPPFVVRFEKQRGGLSFGEVVLGRRVPALCCWCQNQSGSKQMTRLSCHPSPDPVGLAGRKGERKNVGRLSFNSDAYGNRGYSWVLIAVLIALPLTGVTVWFVRG